MRNFLYVMGVLLTFLGIVATLDARADSGTAIVTMLVVLCGIVQVVGAAIVGAINGLHAALVLSRPAYPTLPAQGLPPQR